FYTAEDADSEGVEGKFYLWTPQEVKDVLGDEDGEYFCGLYDISEQGNFEEKNIPNLLDQVLKKETSQVGIPLQDERVDGLRQK
ncbi:MAG TPA: thioredoxin domain-containing protein, partial [Peptococcaceae bacterium]|nr:thioredoxin domain-containing protein [Peptococcaceae bacterium]